MRISDWSSDVCSSDLRAAEAEVGKEGGGGQTAVAAGGEILRGHRPQPLVQLRCCDGARGEAALGVAHLELVCREVEAEGRERLRQHDVERQGEGDHQRSEEHTSELQSLMSTSYA